MDKILSLFNDDRHFWLLARLSNSEQAFADREGLTDFLIETDPSFTVDTVGWFD
ncbi:MAG: hypothetical protein KAX99_06925 [Azonexus sp.]|jgi:hypothetical protein|nr:hypothetical protein [Azonexus sp.]